MAYLDETGLKHLWDKIIDKIYPVGSIYMSVNSTSPATIYGGTWEQIKGKFLLAEDGSTYKAGTQGGEATHKLTVNEMPTHNHLFVNNGGTSYERITVDFANKSSPLQIDNANGQYAPTGLIGQTAIGSAGGNTAHNNMPPYVAVYIWKRTA